jgi:hypothetical protein
MKNARKLGWFLLGMGIYAGLLLLLTAAESASPDSSINSFSDALWYSIVTISTVGYGDLYPVTWPGKIIGLLFVVLSVGALAFLVGAAVQLMTGTLLPRLRMWLRRKDAWYIFSEDNESVRTLAASIAVRDPKAALLLPLTEQDKDPAFLYYPGSMLREAKHKKENCHLFYINDASGSNFAPALEASSLGHPVYCRTEQIVTTSPGNLRLFDRYSCCARTYWANHPLHPGHRRLLLVGNGRYAVALLEQGLLQNLFGPQYTTEYHLCGHWQNFLSNHPQLPKALFQDKLVLHESWNEDFDLICGADRILLCSEDEAENMAVLRQLRKYYPVAGQIHLRASQSIPGEQCFGTNEQIYNRDVVLADVQTRVARAMHEIYRRNYPDNVPAWEQLSDFTKQSNLAAADHLTVKIRLLLQDPTLTGITAETCRKAYGIYEAADDVQKDACYALEHQRWMRFHSLYNWRYGSERNNAARIHPQMRPFEDLPRNEQLKDAYAWQLLEPLAAILDQITEE